MTDRLTKISIEDLKYLRDLYKPDGIKSYSAYVTIDTYVRWLDQDPKANSENIHFFCLNGDISGGTFVVFVGNVVRGSTLNRSSDELFRLLLLLDYSTEKYFVSYNEYEASVVKKVVAEKNLNIGVDDSILLYSLKKEKALEFDISHSDEIELKPLTKLSDLQTVYSVWPQAGRNPFEAILDAAKYNPSVAAFTKDGTIVAWILRFLFGPLTALQTQVDYQKRGLAMLVTKALAKKVAEMGHDPTTTIFRENIASQKLFEKLGFQKDGNFYILNTKAETNEN